MEEISIKLYSENGGGIRRFPFNVPRASADANEYVGIYNALLEKIKEIFPNPTSGVELFWKDDDGDLIVMKTDAEVKEALRQRKGDIFRIFSRVAGNQGIETIAEIAAALPTEQPPAENVTVQQPPLGNEADGTNQPSENVVGHGNVVCDGCNQHGIRGIRFKCLICPDYDLCETCEGKRVHDQHAMLRITKAEDLSWVPAFKASQRWLTDGPRFSFGRYHVGKHGRCPAHGRFAAESQQQRGANSGTNQQPEQQNGDIPGANFLRDIGQAVAAVLNGFGIDVDVDVDHNGHRTNVASPKKDKQEEASEKKANEEAKESAEAAAPQEVLVTPEVLPCVTPKGNDPMETGTIPTETQQEWTLLDTSDAPATVAPTPDAAAAGSTSTQPATDPRVAQALAYMTSMGFTNDGGWLTQLLEAKNGDIAAVLDILHPFEKQ